MTITLTTLHGGIILLPFVAINTAPKRFTFGWLSWRYRLVAKKTNNGQSDITK